MMSRSNPLISVIVPMYNVQGYVAKCMASLSAQTLADFEVIVIDDGSTDGSLSEAQTAIGTDLRFRLIQQENSGLSEARNVGLELAQGTFIAFVDSDDSVTPSYLFRLWQALENTGADWVACGIRFTFPDGSSSCHSAIHGHADLHGIGVLTRHKIANWEDVIRHFPSAWNKLYRRKLIDGLRFSKNTWFEDHTFYYQAAARTDHLLHLAAPLYVQTRERPGQITGSDSDRVFEQFDVLDKIHTVLNDTSHPGSALAFQNITSRLLFERSTALRDPDRRAKYASASATFLKERSLTYAPDWDSHISLAWGLEMSGELPLSVVIPWCGQYDDLLSESLASLTRQGAPGREILIVCDNATAADNARELAHDHPNVRVIVQRGKGPGTARNTGLDAAKGVFVCFIDAGDQLTGMALHEWVDGLIRTDGDFAISAYRQGVGSGSTQSSFIDSDPPADLIATGQSGRLSPEDALRLDPRASAKLYRRSFMNENDIRFGTGCLSDWQVPVKAALLARTVVYIPWPRCDVNQMPKALGQTRHRWSAAQLARSVDRLVGTLGKHQSTRLPAGWQRRLFARALQAQISEAIPRRGTVGKVFLAASFTWSASWRGMTRHRTPLDPGIGGQLEQILSIEAIMRGKPAPAMIPASTNYTSDTDVSHATIDIPTLPFKLLGLTRFRYRANFSQVPYANISFFDKDHSDILFHLSLQQDEGLCVCNKRMADIWAKEIRRDHALHKTGVEVEIIFDTSTVTVTLDGAQIFRFGGRLPRRKFTDLSRIAFVSFQGGITPIGLDAGFHHSASREHGHLHLNNRLELRARLQSNDATEKFVLDVPRVEPTPMVVAYHDTHTQSAVGHEHKTIETVAILPGRVWNAVEANMPLVIELQHSDGHPACPKLQLSRADLATKIEHILSETDCRTDCLLAMQILEHVRYAGLYENLSQKAHVTLNAVQSFFGLDDYPLTDGSKTTTATRMPTSTFDPLIQAQAQFGRKMRTEPETDPLDLLRVVSSELAATFHPNLYLSLSEFFCAQDRDYKAFHQHLTKAGLTGRMSSTKSNVWQSSAILPILFLQGRYDQVISTLWSIHSQNIHWITTPAIAWIMRTTTSDPRLGGKDRDEIIHACLALLDKMAGDYWGQVHCLSLTKATARLVVHKARLSEHLHTQLIDTALRVYGLSRQFWQALDDTPTDRPLPPKLLQAKAAFAVIAMPSEAGQSNSITDQALALFQTIGCVETLRFRRELMGPAGISVKGGDALGIDALTQDGLNASEAAIRHMAFPGTASVDEDVVEIVVGALPDHYGEIARAPYYNTQIQIVVQIHDLLKQAVTQPVTLAQIEGLSAELRQLSDPSNHFLGLGLILSLVRGLLPYDGHHKCLAALLKLAEECIEPLDQGARQTLCSATAPRHALMALRATANADHIFAQAASILADCARDLPEIAPLSTIAPSLPGSPLFDTIVIIFSCRPNLETRVPALRDGWLSLLEPLGIPYLIVVGDGDGRVEGDVVHLNVPDDYEGLPQKTLAAIKWVYENTGFSHMLKVDDDCFLNVALVFHALSHRKYDYFGRILTRQPGQMDRAWHNQKSTSDRGKYELDKSPEPSSYADGGSGYALSRTAMAAVLSAVDSPEGQYLVQLSFMEDKMLGDLLALRGIAPVNEDYRTTILRRTWGGAHPVSMWVNSFFPSRAAPVSLVHLDDHVSQGAALETLTKPVLTPKKIWPSYQDAALVYQSNALELISSQDKLDVVQQASLAVVSCMRNEMFMLPLFLKHYRKLGVESFLIADNCSDDGTLEYLIKQPDVALFSVDTDYNQSEYGVAWQQAMLSAFRVGKWSLMADADELLVWQEKQTQTLPQLLNEPAFQNVDAVRIFMLDMYPKGPLSKANFETNPFLEAGFTDREPFLTDWVGRGPFSNTPTWTSALRHRLIPGSRPDLFVAQKIALLKYQPWMHLSAGLHYVSDIQLSQQELIFAHFKYNAEFRRKAQTEVGRRQHFNDAAEYRKYLALTSEGRDVVYDSELSVPWTEAPFIKTRLIP